jgi:hypothetical protein
MRKQVIFGLVATLALIWMISVPARAQAIWTDPATGLMWTHQDNGTDINWEQAKSYCANLRLGSFSNWRLATIEELEVIYAPSPGDSTQIKGGIRLTHPAAIIWSSSDGAMHLVWVFHYDHVQHTKGYAFDTLTDGLRTLCVRRP